MQIIILVVQKIKFCLSLIDEVGNKGKENLHKNEINYTNYFYLIT